MTYATATATTTPGTAAHPPPLYPYLPTPPPWHVIRATPNHERALADAIANDLCLETYCPSFLATWVIRGRRREATFPYLRGYLFARWDAADPYLWHELTNLDHCTGFIGGELPAPVPDDQINTLKDYIGEDGHLVEANKLRRKLIPVGTRILVTRGPFATRSGTVEEATPDGILVTVNLGGLLGRDIGILMPAEWCDRLELSDDPLPRTAQGGTRLGEPGKKRTNRP